MVSASNSCPRGFRIKIDLSELISDGLRRLWFFVDLNICKTIADLQRVISARFRLPCSVNDFEFQLQDFVIPSDEAVDILQADDLLLLRRLSPRQCTPQQLNLMVEERATACLPCERCRCCWEWGKRKLASPGSKSTDNEFPEQNQALSIVSSTPRKKKKSKSLSNANVVTEVTSKSVKHGHKSIDDEFPVETLPIVSSSHKKKKKEKSKSLSDASAVPEVTSKSTKHNNKNNSFSEESEANKSAEISEEIPNSSSKKSKKSKKSKESLVKESSKEKNSSKNAVLSVVDRDTTVCNEQSPKGLDVLGLDFTFQELPKKKRIRHRHSKSKHINNTHSEIDVSAVSEDRAPRISEPSFNFGFKTSAKHFRFGDENEQESDDSSKNVKHKGLSPFINLEEESVTYHEVISKESNPDTIPIKCINTNGKLASHNRTLAANLPNICKSPDVAADANKGRALDYSQYPALIGHPRVKDVVAYKILELSEDYMPKVSDYLIGEVISINPSTKEVTIQFLTPVITKARKGKFELVEDEMDDEFEPEEEIVTSATVEWPFVIDPKLLPSGAK